MTSVINELIKPGGPFDRRLRINIEDQHLKLSDRDVIADLRGGTRDFRVTSIAAQRGPSPNVNFKDIFRQGLPFISMDQERLEKNLYP